MAEVPLSAVALPHDLSYAAVELTSKPGALMHYCTVPGHDLRGQFSSTVLVYLNGLMTPATPWIPVLAMVVRDRKARGESYPSMLAYDRYGQGRSTDRDPTDRNKEPGHGHNVRDAAMDLHQLVIQLHDSDTSVILVCSSIGCAIARLYAELFPGTVTALVFLDSIMANSDFVSIFPDPDTVDSSTLPEDLSIQVLRDVRGNVAKMFHPSLSNPEGLSRRDLAALLPHAGSPPLYNATGKAPILRVIGHDPEKFALDNLTGPLAMPLVMTTNYLEPHWRAYNLEVTKLVPADRSFGPDIAPGCGHFIHRDNPQFVATAVSEMLDQVLSSVGK